MSYTQLTREQRYQIYALRKAGHTQAETAALVGVHESTISRELRRNRGGRGYRPGRAHELAQARQRAAHRPRISGQTWETVESLLRREWSPEQVAGRLRLEGRAAVSHERIYRHVYADSEPAARSTSTCGVSGSGASVTGRRRGAGKSRVGSASHRADSRCSFGDTISKSFFL
jgi:IS30 family transposase